MTPKPQPAPTPEAIAATRRRLARLLALGAVRAATRSKDAKREEAADALAG